MKKTHLTHTQKKNIKKLLEILKFRYFHSLLYFRCWWGYNFTSIYWILEGPRLAVLLLNFIFLLNIIRVLVVKLRQSHSSDIEQVRKAVRAAIVLIPLLGITNILNMTEAPLHKTALEFGIWSYTTHFLTSFQGLFIAMIYCFLNNEVGTEETEVLCVYACVTCCVMHFD